MRYVVMTLVVLLAAHTFSQPANGQYIETSPLSTTDTYLTSGDTTVTLGVNVQDTSVFNRRQHAAIEFGMNWGSSAASTTATSMFGLSLIDDYPRNMIGGLAHFEDRPVRIIAALTGAYDGEPDAPPDDKFGDIHSFYSNGIATQVDPEVTLVGGQHPTTYPNTDQTGAVHGFKYRHADVSVQPSYVSLASVATPPTNMTLVLQGNSNSGVMYGTPTQRGAWGDWRNNREQNGNRIYVTVRLRRGADVPSTLADDAVVLRLQLYDRNPDPKVDAPDTLKPVPLMFATVPVLTSTDGSISTYPDAANTTNTWSTERGKYWAVMSARDTVGENNAPNLASSKRLGTVDSTVAVVPSSQVFDITAGMLRALPVADESTSEWVEFSASVEFKRVKDGVKKDEYERTTEFISDNSNLPLIDVKTDNPGFDEKRLVDDPKKPTVLINTNELSLEVYYAQNAAVDIDWIRFETPHARRILRDEYRYEIARGVKKFVDFFTDSIASKNSGARILGIRLMEELDEEGWLVQRYLHRLLNGYAVTEQHGHPNNRWRHVVGASDLGSADPLPTWHWNGSSNFHPRAETPAPYVHVGHGGNWFNRDIATQQLEAQNVIDDAASVRMDQWHNSVIQASLDLKFGMRRAFIDRNIRFDTSGVPKYRSTSGDLTDLEVGDVDATFPTWWNDLSAYELEYGGYYERNVNGQRTLVIKNDSETYTHLRNQTGPYASLVGSDVFTANSDMPLQMGIDKARYQYVYRSDKNAHLFKSRPWLEQIWCYNRYKGVYSSADSNQSMLQHDALRPHTAEELRLSLASAMIFGAKGYMFFAGSAGHDYTVDNDELYERGMS